MSSDAVAPRWHAALAYALLGPPVRDLPEAGVPQPAALVDALGGAPALRERIGTLRSTGPWPYEVPAELRRGLGPAQYAAVWRTLTELLGPLSDARQPVGSDRALTPAERRLSEDRPPHHGG